MSDLLERLCVCSLYITTYPEDVSIVKGLASVDSDIQTNPIVDTVQGRPTDDSAIANSEEREIDNVEDPARLTLSDLVGDEKLQDAGGHATPTHEGLHIHSEQDRVALEALEHIEHSPESQAGVIRVLDGK